MEINLLATYTITLSIRTYTSSMHGICNQYSIHLNYRNSLYNMSDCYAQIFTSMQLS